jgi:hypothetical protein
MRYLSFCVLLLCPFLSFAQAKPVTLNGALQLNTGETFPYKIILTESNGIVSGYSFTYSEPNDTKTKIQGKLDRMNHTLTFKETEIVYSHTVRTKAYMCLIDAKLKYVPGGKENMLKGAITSMEADKTACTGGSIVFSNNEEIQFLFAYHDQLDTVINMKRKVTAPVTETKELVPEQPLTIDKVTTGVEKTYEWHSDTVVIDVWDGGTTDGDRITIQFNGKTMLTDYYLIKQKKQLRIPLAEGVNTVTIIAENEGSDPPNTASMLFTDGTKKYCVLAYNNKGQRSLIKIKRVRP